MLLFQQTVSFSVNMQLYVTLMSAK